MHLLEKDGSSNALKITNQIIHSYSAVKFLEHDNGVELKSDLRTN